jgi:uncharacterized membrane-anchored protein
LKLRRSAALAALALFVFACTATADETAPPSDHKAEQSAATDAAEKAAVHGPASPRLGDQGAIDLPQGALFVPEAEGARWMRAYGNIPDSQLVGLMFPAGDGGWWARIDYVAAGHVSDDDAANWKADDLLKHIQDATLSGNEERKSRGFPPIEVTGWVEPPKYDKTTRRLVWSAMVKELSSTTDAGSINYNTYALGREGYYSVDFITDPEHVDKAKQAAADLLAAIRFDKGRAYADFNASTDHIAEFGLAALVGGFALKKLGLLALGAAFFVKFAKIIGVAVVGGGVAIRRLLSRRKSPNA